MKYAHAGRPRQITAEKLDSLKATATKMGNSVVKACRSQHKNYVSVLVAAKTLNHSILKLVKVYKARKA
jgi:hypothetical protein